MDMADITKAGSLMVKTAKDGTETWIFPITSTDNITHHDTEQLDEYLDAMEKSIVKTDATQTQHGLLSTDDKKKLDGIASGATKVTVDDTLSGTSTNAIQNKAVQEAINAVSTKVDNIIKDAPEAYDTFKEISEYISSHKTEYDALLAVSNNKVDKVDGKGLSTNDFTAAYKTKLDALTNLEIVTSLPSSVTSDSSYLLIDSAETA